MKIQVLGSAAGGGFPQWNCNCHNCCGVRNGTIKAQPRTQSSIAVSSDDKNWLLMNASPDIRAQLESFPDIQPQQGLRDTGITAVMLADSQIDHTTGLLMLREGCPLPVYATDMVQEDLSTGFPLFTMLKSWNGGLELHTLSTDEQAFTIPSIVDIEFIAVPIDGKAPPYSPHRHDPHIGDNIGLFIHDIRSGKRVFYAPGLAKIGSKVRHYIEQSDCVMLDGTFWQEDEMAHAGVGSKLASQMGHLPQSGDGGMLEYLKTLPESTRKILIHINNTNPILLEDSAERKQLEAANIEVAYDGMSIILEQSA